MQKHHIQHSLHSVGIRRANELASNYMHISPHQCIMILLCANIGSSILILPSILAQYYTTKAWFVLLCGGLLGCVSCILIHMAYQKTNADSLFSLLCCAFGPYFSKLIMVLYRLTALLRAGITVGIFSGAVKGLILPDHTRTMICICICLALFFTLRCDAIASARVCSIGMMFLMAVLLLMLLCLPAMRSAYVLPIEPPMQNEISFMFPFILFTASGPDILLFLYPDLKIKKICTAIMGQLLGCAVKLGTFFSACSIFGFYAIAEYAWPMITMFKANDLIRIDRPELLFITLFTIFCLTPAHLYASAAIRSAYQTDRQQLIFSIFATLFLFLVARIPSDVSDLTIAMQYIGLIFLAVGLLLPFCIWVFGRRKGEQHA